MNSDKHIAIIGATGMVGSNIYRALRDKCNLSLVARSLEKLSDLQSIHGGYPDNIKIVFDVASQNPEWLFKQIGPVDMVINCIGETSRDSCKNPRLYESYYVLNTAWPQVLSRQYGKKLVHISTDCVFDGKIESYDSYVESSLESPAYGMYGLSKFLGECIEVTSLILRCCVVGHALNRETSPALLDWFSRQQGEIHGYTEWCASVITGIELGNICWRICNLDDPGIGLKHIAANKISKFDVLSIYNKYAQIDCEITPDDTIENNKTLGTNHRDWYNILNVPSFEEMMRQQFEAYSDGTTE